MAAGSRLRKLYRPGAGLKALIPALVIALSALLVLADGFLLTEDINGRTFTVLQDTEFWYDMNTTCNESLIVYSDNSDTADPQPFYVFNLSSDTGIMQFTPSNSDVGVSSWITVIIENRSQKYDKIVYTIRFNVTNANDPPFITGSYPGNITVPENTNLSLYVNASDIDLPYGDSLTYNWSLDGNLSPKLLFSSNTATYAIPYNDFDVGNHTIAAVVYDYFGQAAVTSWTIGVSNKNIPPQLNRSFSNISTAEDNSLYNYLDLDDYFYDLDVNSSMHDVDTGVRLQFSAHTSDSSPLEITVFINDTNRNVSFILPDDWNGNKSLYFRVFDGYAYAYGNNFTLMVNEVNDPPSIGALQNQSIYANSYFSYQVSASDVDGDLLTYYSNSSVFQINATTGLVSAVAGNSMAFLHVVNISVGDGEYNTSKLLNITVLPNMIPKIFSIPNQSVQQNSTIFINASGYDELGDSLVFTSNFSQLGQGNRINSTLTIFNMTPISQALVGNRTVMISVNDSKGIGNSTVLMLEIRDLPRAPSLYYIPGYTIRANKTFMLDLVAFDEDGNIDAFSSNTSFLNIVTTYKGSISENATGTLTYTPTSKSFFAVNLSVNDTSSPSRSDSQVFTINVTANSPPYFTFISNVTCEEDSVCPIGFSAFTAADPDWQDTAVFSDNSSWFGLNPDGAINFSPTYKGFQAVMVNITDGELSASYVISVNVTELNDPPFFSPAVESLAVWNTIVEGSAASFNITAYDEENATCNFTVSFINFTDLNGTLHTSGISLFNVTNLGNTTNNMSIGHINFTPNSSQPGYYYVNISADDGVNEVSSVFGFEVQNYNNPPSVSWLLTYYNYSTSSATTISVDENRTVSISVSASDPDYDDIAYRWTRQKEGALDTLSSSSSLDYTFGFTDSPQINLTLSVTDSNNKSTNITWKFNVMDINRMQWFGMKKDSTFRGWYWNISNTSSLVLSYNSTSNIYPASGIFMSDAFDIGETNSVWEKFILDRIEYDSVMPPGTNITLQTRTKTASGSNYSAWADLGAGGKIMSESERFIQYRVLMSNSGNSTPVLYGLKLYYLINNMTGYKSVILQDWISLDNFFTEPDSDESCDYEAHTTSLAFYANVTVTEDNFAVIQFIREGEEYINFSCTDKDNNTVYSNSIYVQIETLGEKEVPQPTPISTGGGGGGVVTRYKTQIKTKDVPVSLDIIHPSNVTIFENDTMSIPVTIRNLGNTTLTGLNISAISENNFTLHISKTRIAQLETGDEETILIRGDISRVYDSFQILVRVDVEEPSYTDTAKITINSLKKGKADRDMYDIKYAFAQDLLTQNPMCLELTEFLERAQARLDANDFASASAMLDDFVGGCRYMISEKAQLQQKPSPISTAAFLVDRIQADKELRYLAYLAAFVLLFFMGYIGYVKYKSI